MRFEKAKAATLLTLEFIVIVFGIRYIVPIIDNYFFDKSQTSLQTNAICEVLMVAVLFLLPDRPKLLVIHWPNRRAIMQMVAMMMLSTALVKHSEHQQISGDLFFHFIYRCLIPALMEEYAFRGWFLFKLEKIIGRNISIVISSIVFSASHQGLNWLGYIFTFAISCCFALMSLQFGTSTIVIPNHIWHNFLVVVFPELFPSIVQIPNLVKIAFWISGSLLFTYVSDLH